MKNILALLFVFTATFLVGSPAWAKSLPLEYFASLPDVSHVSLSPDGKKMSALVRIDVDTTQGTAVQITDLATNKQDIVLFSDNQKYIIYGIWWKDNRTLLVHTFHPDKRDTWVGAGQVRFDTRDTRLLIVDTESGDVTTPFSKNFLRKYPILPSKMDMVVDSLPHDPEHILLAFPTNRSSMGSRFVEVGVYKVNIKNQRSRLIQKSIDHVQGWMTDRQHRVRVGFYYHPQTGMHKVLVKNHDNDEWRELWSYATFSEDQNVPMGFGLDPNVLYLSAYHDGRLAVFKVNLSDKNLTRELVYADPAYDVSGQLVYSPVTKEVVGITYSAGGGFTFFDSELKQLQVSLDNALVNSKNFILSLSEDAQKYVVFSTSDTDSGTYFIGQRTPAKLDAVALRYKHLKPELMSSVKRYDYKARDGLDIEAYLTLPKNSKGKNLPTIIFPHGGPIARDDDSFSYWTQYFANKGYAVLQMNFRGSAGQGLEFRNAGLKSWGMEMQDDIEDGAKKLIADGISDSNSICIVGASYGGYAALMGAVKTPEFYRCSVSVAGVSNVLELVKDNRAFWRSYNVVDEMIGNDNKQLRAISPVNHADKIKVPVLLIHGDSDRQVDIKHSVQMHDALKKAGKDVTFLALENEDHYLSNNDNRVATFRAIDTFLDRHLPVSK